MPSLPRARVRSLFARLRALTGTARDLFPLTLPGLVSLAGAALALAYYGFGRIDLLLLMIGAVGLATAALALLAVLAAAVRLRLHLRPRPTGAAPLEPVRLDCGVAGRTGFALPRLGWVPFVKIAWTWIEPRARVRVVREGGRLHEEIVPLRRFLGERVVRRIEVADAFGLFRIAFRSAEARAAAFAPATGALEHVQVVRSISGGEDVYDPLGMPEGERVDTRAYASGDPMRLILWKVFARSRQLVVRTPERAYSVSRRTLAYLVAGEGDEPAAGAARVALERGALGSSWVVGADGNDHDATTARDALELLARSASAAEAEQGAGLAPFLKRNIQGATGRAVVFVPARPGPWLARVIAAIRARTPASAGAKAPVEIVVATDGIDRDAPRSVLGRLAFARAAGLPADTPRTPAKELAAVVSALGAARAHVVVVDRVSGRVYAGAHRRALLEPASAALPASASASAPASAPASFEHEGTPRGTSTGTTAQ